MSEKFLNLTGLTSYDAKIKAHIQAQVNQQVAGTFRFKGEKTSTTELNAITSMVAGDVWQVGDKEYAYNGEEWVELGLNIDLSSLVKVGDHISADLITETTLRKFVTSTQIAAWTAKWDWDEDEIKGVKVNEAGDADTVNGKTVGKDVPVDAKFTDTVYTHPSSHPASMITESTTKKFVSDTEKSNWNAKQAAMTAITTSEINALFD